MEKRAREHLEFIALPSGWPPNCCGRGDAAVKHLEWIEAEVGRLEVRMRVLLDDGEATP